MSPVIRPGSGCGLKRGAGWRRPVALTGLLLLLNLAGCGSPAVRLHEQAVGFGFNTVELSAGGFVLAAFYRPAEPGGKRLHVYLEGDGRPWEQGLIAAADPTTRASVMLPLMAMDGEPSLYLGRPCYNGHAGDPGCDAALWTGARYGEKVITVLAEALQDFCRRYGYREWLLVGHSGGGSLAMLLAKRLPQTRALVTLAGNYDIDAWSDYHGYQRLSGSINPAAGVNNGIPEWHFLAEHDRNIPPSLFFQALKSRKNSRVEIIPGIDHGNGWRQVWPEILSRLAASQ